MNDLAQATEATGALIDHILTRHHAVHRSELPEIAIQADRVERVHHDHADAPLGLVEVPRRMIGEMEAHMKKEELILFPAMRGDHDSHAAEIAQIRRIATDLTLPEGACWSWTALYAGTGKFLDDLETHMRLENEILFPRFDTGMLGSPGRS